MMFIQLIRTGDGKPCLVNTDHIDILVKAEEGTNIYFAGEEEPFEVNNDYDQVADIIMAHEKKKTAIETGTLNVKIVNPH